MGILFDTLYIKYKMSLINPELFEATIRPLIEKIVEEKLEKFKNEISEKLSISQAIEKPIPVKEMSAILGISVSHLYKKCKNNEMPHKYRFGRLYFYLSEIKDWMND